MAGGDRGPSTKVLAADVDEVGVGGEGSGERGAVHGVPGGLQLADNALERSSLARREIGRHHSRPAGRPGWVTSTGAREPGLPGA